MTTKSKMYRGPGWGLVCAAMLPIVVSACVQTSRTGSRLAEPNQGSDVVATSDPLVLNGVAYTQGDATTRSSNSRPPPNANVTAVPAGGAPEAVVSSTPLPSTEPALTTPPAAAGQTDVPAASSAPVTTADGYPNINLTPQQPQSKLLTPEERAKLIEELNALAGRPSAAQ